MRAKTILANFQVGIGIAHGRAVAGKIGTVDQVKVTVFGPVVNLASRLESMTKQLRVPIVIDAGHRGDRGLPVDCREGRVRTLGKILPYGTDTPVVVNELLPPADASELTDEHLKLYNEAVEHFIAGRWEDAYRRLHMIPAGDRAQDFLSMVIAHHNRVAPPEWDGRAAAEQMIDSDRPPIRRIPAVAAVRGTRRCVAPLFCSQQDRSENLTEAAINSTSAVCDL